MSELQRQLFTSDLVESDEQPNCPFCQERLKRNEEVVKCPEVACGRWHHVACWIEMGNHCAQYGCPGEGEIDSSPLSPPSPEPPPPSVPFPPRSWVEEIELMPVDLPQPTPEVLPYLIDEIELLPENPADDVIDIDLFVGAAGTSATREPSALDIDVAQPKPTLWSRFKKWWASLF
jgi:hypothetical protein